MVSARSLTKDCGSLRAVNGLDLEIAPGEFFAFLGPNAAGKTTTIKMLAGRLRPTSGTVVIGGFDLHREPEKAKAQLADVPDFPFSTTSSLPRNLCASSATFTRWNAPVRG